MTLSALMRRTGKRKNTMKRILILASAVTLCFAVSACNTTAGVGKDLKSAGKEIEKTAEGAK
jgi:entericidin B